MKVNMGVNFRRGRNPFHRKGKPNISFKIGNKVNFGKSTDQLDTQKRRSLFENQIDSSLKSGNIDYEYESMIIPWNDLENKPHKYHPDYLIKLKRNQILFIEAKGLFDLNMLLKYTKLLEQHSELRKFFIIVWQNSNLLLNMNHINMYSKDSPAPTKKMLSYLKLSKRSKYTYREVCDKLGIKNIEYSEMIPYINKNYKLR